MSNIVDLQAHKNAKVQPAFDFIQEIDGEKWYSFLCEYQDADGASFAFEVWARNLEDAEKRVAAIRVSASLFGQAFMAIKE